MAELVFCSWSPLILENLGICAGTSLARCADANVLVVPWGMPANEVAGAIGCMPLLKWVHTLSSSVEQLSLSELGRRGVVVTNSADIHAVPVAEWVIAQVFHFAKLPPRPRDVFGGSMIILGMGAVGRALALRAQAIGMAVHGVNRSPRDVAGVTMHGLDGGWRSILRHTDYLVSVLPCTPETRGLIDAAVLCDLPQHGVVIGAGRGGVISEMSLANALRDGHLRGAALDVFEVEPLPMESPLRQIDNMVISPHVAWKSHTFWEREAALVRRLAGELGAR